MKFFVGKLRRKQGFYWRMHEFFFIHILYSMLSSAGIVQITRGAKFISDDAVAIWLIRRNFYL